MCPLLEHFPNNTANFNSNNKQERLMRQEIWHKENNKVKTWYFEKIFQSDRYSAQLIRKIERRGLVEWFKW
jgi:hypothetical protein